MALTQNAAPPKFGGHLSNRDLPVAANEWIFRGAAVGVNPAGYAKEFVAGDRFVGFAMHEFKADSTAGVASLRGEQTDAGQRTINITCYADNVTLPVSSAARTDIGKYVYATDDGTFALSGHPDGKVGRVIDLDQRSGFLTCEMRDAGQHVENFGGVQVVQSDFGGSFREFITAAATTGSDTYIDGFKMTAVGAGIATGAGIAPIDGAAGGQVKMLLDNDNEAQNLTLETGTFMNVLKGMSFTLIGRINVLGPTATTDVDFGIMTAANSAITAAIRANMLVTTAAIGQAMVHSDGDSVNYLFGSDDDTTLVSPLDTTIDNSLTVNKRWDIIVRPSGLAEVWADRVRLLGTTTFSVGTTLTTLYAGIVNIEKSTGTDVSSLAIDFLRVAGAS